MSPRTAEERLRAVLSPLRGYPTDGVSHDRHWVSDPNGAYVGFEDAVDAALAADPVPAPLDGDLLRVLDDAAAVGVIGARAWRAALIDKASKP